MSGAKTEEPTPRRLRKAREEGDTGASVFASQAIALVAGIALLPATAAAVAARVEERLRDAIQRAAEPGVAASFDVGRAAGDVALLSLPVLAGVAIAAAASSLVQTGGFVGMGRLAPKLERLNPFVTGRPGLLSRARVFAVIRAIVGGALVAWVVVHELRAHALDIVRTSGRVAIAGPTAAALAKTIAWEIALAGLAIAAVDIVVTRAYWRGRLRMSRDEVRREAKEAEGDPLAKEARERARGERIARGAIADVKGAKAVVCDGAKAACALRYEDGDAAPVVLATGEGEVAEGIVREARARGVPVVENGELARALADMRAGEAIPEELYDAVAELLRDTG